MVFRVTFDSNVLGDILKERNIINKAIKKRLIIACVAETVFTYDAIHKKDRLPWLQGKITPKLRKATTFKKAMALSFKVLRCPRIGAPKYLPIPKESYLSDSDIVKRQKTFLNDCLPYITSLGCGIHQLKEIGLEHLPRYWQGGFRSIETTEEKRIWRAVAEWADGDSIAAHIAYGNDFYCTGDRAKNAGSRSIFHSSNVEKLEARYRIRIVTQQELESELEL